MKCLIVTNAYDKGLSQQKKVERITAELQALDVQTETVTNDRFLAYIKDGKAFSSVDADFCFYFDKDKYTAELLEQCGLKLFNSAKSMAVCDDKMQTHICLAQSGIPMPNTIGGALCYTQDATVSREYLQGVTDRLGLPLVVKQCYGSFGAQVFLANTFDELAKITDRVKHSAYLFQSYVAESCGRDVRVIVIGSRAVCAMLRQNDNDFRSNVELGGKATAVKITPQIAEICEQTAVALKLDYCGIDVLLSDNGPLVCEVNSNAMFNAMEQATGFNVAKMYVEHALSVVKRK